MNYEEPHNPSEGEEWKKDFATDGERKEQEAIREMFEKVKEHHSNERMKNFEKRIYQDIAIGFLYGLNINKGRDFAIGQFENGLKFVRELVNKEVTDVLALPVEQIFVTESGEEIKIADTDEENKEKMKELVESSKKTFVDEVLSAYQEAEATVRSDVITVLDELTKKEQTQPQEPQDSVTE